MITVRRGTYIGRRKPKPASPQERKKKKKQITHAKKQQKGRRSDYTLFLNTDCCLRACVRFRKRQPQQGQCGRANKKKRKIRRGMRDGTGPSGFWLGTRVHTLRVCSLHFNPRVAFSKKERQPSQRRLQPTLISSFLLPLFFSLSPFSGEGQESSVPKRSGRSA